MKRLFPRASSFLASEVSSGELQLDALGLASRGLSRVEEGAGEGGEKALDTGLLPPPRCNGFLHLSTDPQVL